MAASTVAVAGATGPVDQLPRGAGKATPRDRTMVG